MKKFALIALLFCCLFQHNSFAEERSKESFIVRDIKISEVGIDSKEARQKAVKTAQKKAFEMLVDRFIGVQFDIDAKPDEIETLIESIEIKNEAITNQNYAASFTIHFNQNYTTYFLDKKIMDAKEHEPAILVIPVMNENGFFKLWQYGNLWKTALNSISPKTVVDIKVPSGDIDDLENFVVENFAHYGEDSIAQLKVRYGVDKIIVATIFYEYNSDYSSINLSLHLGELGSVENRTLLASKALMPNEDINVSLVEYANLLYKQLDEAWVNFSTLSIAKKRNKQSVVFEINNVADLKSVYDELNKINFIDSWELASLSTRYVGINLLFDQTPLELVDNLKAQGYNISRNGNHLFVIGRK